MSAPSHQEPRRRARKLLRLLLLLAAAGFVLLNILAYNHARAMTHFVEGGVKTPKPEALSFFEKVRVLFVGVQIPRPHEASTPADRGLAFEKHTIRCTNGIRLGAWYVPGGATNPPARARALVVMCHGYGADKSSALVEAEAFHRLGCAVLLVDFRGSGESSESSTTIGYLEAEDVAEMVRYARATFSPSKLVLFGQSMGAAAVLRAIHAHGVSPDGVIVEAVFDTMLNTVKNRFQAMRAPSFPAAELLVFWGGVQGGFNGFNHNPRTYASAVKCPALFLHGVDDTRARLVEAQTVYEAVRGPKTFKEFSGTQHESYAKRAPLEWAEAVGAFSNRMGN